MLDKEYFALLELNENKVKQLEVSGISPEIEGGRRVKLGKTLNIAPFSSFPNELEVGKMAILWDGLAYNPELAFYACIEKIKQDHKGRQLTTAQSFVYRKAIPAYEMSNGFLLTTSFEEGCKYILEEMDMIVHN